MERYIYLLILLTLSFGCDNRSKSRVVIERPAPPQQEVTISDSTGGVVPLPPEELDEPEIPYAEVDSVAAELEPVTNPPLRTAPAPVKDSPLIGTAINLSRFNTNIELASKGNTFFKRAAGKAVAVGNDAMKRPLVSVADKTFTNGLPIDKRNMLTFAPYWHKQSNGVWKRIDGKGNGLSERVGDTKKLQGISTTILDLAVAYSVTDDEKYAARAVANLKNFFLDSKKGMLPNLEYAQLVPGNKDLRPEAMVESGSLVKVCDALTMLKGSKSYNAETERAAKAWFAKFLNWMQTSPKGRAADERLVYNIAALYELQLASYASFTDNDEFLGKRFQRVIALLEKDLNKDNLFHGELGRAKPNMYSNKALAAWVQIAKVYNQRGYSLWAWEKNGKSLKKAGLALLPYMMGEKVMKRGESIKPAYALAPFRTIQYTYRADKDLVNKFQRYRNKYDTAFMRGDLPAALYEPAI